MSSETDQPRQRTVAELLAQHGGNDAASTGRRRRRRDPDEAADDVQEQPGGQPDGGAPWPPSRSPNPERPTGQPPTALAGSAREPGSPRPPAALPQQYAPPAPGPNTAPGPNNGAGPNGAGPNNNGAGPAQRNGAPVNGAGRGGPPPQTGQWAGPSPRREPDQAWSDRSEPQRRNPPTSGWERPAAPPPRQDRPGAPWDARPWEPAAAEPQRPVEQGFRDQAPPRAFAPGPEPVRSTPPFAPSPHAGAAPLPTAAAPFGPPGGQPGGQPGAPPGRPRFPDDPALTGPIDPQRLQALQQSEATSRVQSPLADRSAPSRPADDGGPATAVGIPPAGAEDWHRGRTGLERPPADGDEGPPTQASAPMDFDDDYDDIDSHPAGLPPARPDDRDGGGAHGFDGAFEDRPDEESDEQAEKGAQSWAPVLAQWVIGAIGGAALWVGFRFLWSTLLVVAIAAAVLVTVGLVVVVRSLLRNSDLRTTLAAVAVGILLTVSPAVLVLLGR